MSRFISVPLAAMTTGQRLQAFRKSAGLTQRELARRAGMKNSTLSTIEQDKVSPTIHSLEKILGAIPVSLDAFFSSEEPRTLIRRRADLYSLARDGLTLEMLPLEFFQETTSLSRLDIGVNQATELSNNESNKLLAGMIMQGALYLQINGIEYRLEEGDGFELSYACRYKLTNRDKRTSTVFIVGDTSSAMAQTQDLLL